MATAVSRLSDDQARKELYRLTWLAFPLPIIAIFVFWWLSLVGALIGIRALALTFHKGNFETSFLSIYRLTNIFIILFSSFDLFFFHMGKGLSPVLGVGVFLYVFTRRLNKK